MDDLQKIIRTASNIIGDIPYNDYSFLAIGPGGGGIEHLNAASVAFNGTGLDSNRSTKLRLYSFLSHEYFHHYNVKRIRPAELGPFDYDSGSRTKMLWLSEGITVYYEYVILRRAGLITDEEMFNLYTKSIFNYESKPGRHFQTPADASYHTWEEGPFGRTGDEVNKTISPYDKGPALGLLLDCKIRYLTNNKKSLDDLMRSLYKKYYQQKKRGFTEAEFRQEAEKIAGGSLEDFFDYIYTLKPVDYTGYLHPAGLNIDTVSKTLPGAWTGLSVRNRNDSLIVTDVEWQSPAWNAGLRKGNQIVSLNGKKVSAEEFSAYTDQSKAGTMLQLSYIGKNSLQAINIRSAVKKMIPYTIRPKNDPTPLQKAILNSWLNGNK